jgi:hypothetical protein
MSISTSSGNYLRVAKSYGGVNKFTVAMWVYPNTSGAGLMAGMWETNTWQWFFSRQSNNWLSFGVRDSWYKTYDFPTGAYWAQVPTQTWTHLVLTFNPAVETGADALRAYVNAYFAGSLPMNDGVNSVLNNVSGSFGLGGSENQAGGTFDGRIAEFATWTERISDAEIVSLYKGFSPRLIRNPDCYIPLVRNVQDRTTGYAITTVGSPTVQDHPRIYL